MFPNLKFNLCHLQNVNYVGIHKLEICAPAESCLTLD